MKRFAVVCALLLTTVLPAARANCLGNEPLRGVNLAGAEFNGERLPGTLFKDFVYPTDTDLRYFAEQGANTVRLPFRWERLQPTLNAPLDDGELGRIVKAAASARKLGLCLILDAHNFGTYRKQPLGSDTVPAAAFTDFWLRVNEMLPEADHLAFGLMNEPAHADRAVWAKAAQDTVLALRQAGSKHLLLVSGGAWSGAHDWMESSNGPSNAEAFAKLRDPLHRTLIEVHQYADADASGTHPDCIAPERMRALMDRVTAWASTHGQRLFLGEFGIAPSPACLLTLQAQLDATHREPWAGWTYWAAGAWWGPTYAYSIHPINGVTRDQLPLLRKEWLHG